MAAPDSSLSLTGDSVLAVPQGTSIAEHDGQVIVSGPVGHKTLSGKTAPLSRRVIEAADGSTRLDVIADTIGGGDDGRIYAVADRLWEAGILYPTELLAPFDVDDAKRNLLESIVLSMDAERRWDVFRTLADESVALRGDSTLTGMVSGSVESMGMEVGGPSPDVIVYAETEGSTDRGTVNRDWLDSEATLVRVGRDGTTVEIGPVLSPSSGACLECLTTRQELNGADRSLDYESVSGGVTYEARFIDHVVSRLVVQAALDLLPAPIAGQVFRYDLATLHSGLARLLGVPGCEACDARN